jgi:hypothetical protein
MAWWCSSGAACGGVEGVDEGVDTCVMGGGDDDAMVAAGPAADKTVQWQ